MRFKRKESAGPCAVPAVTGDRIILPGETIEVPERLAPGFHGDVAWEPIDSATTGAEDE